MLRPASQTRQADVADDFLEKVGVKSISLLSEATSFRFGIGGGRRAVDGVPIPREPAADFFEDFASLGGNLSAGIGRNVEKQIPILGDAIHQCPDDGCR